MVAVGTRWPADTSPVDRALPAFVKAWNERFATPRLVIDTADAMFAEFERRHGASVPVMSGDMTPYWEDGALSTAGEEAWSAPKRAAPAAGRDARRAAQRPAAGRGCRGGVARADPVARAHLGRGDSVSQPDRPTWSRSGSTNGASRWS